MTLGFSLLYECMVLTDPQYTVIHAWKKEEKKNVLKIVTNELKISKWFFRLLANNQSTVNNLSVSIVTSLDLQINRQEGQSTRYKLGWRNFGTFIISERNSFSPLICYLLKRDYTSIWECKIKRSKKQKQKKNKKLFDWLFSFGWKTKVGLLDSGQW